MKSAHRQNPALPEDFSNNNTDPYFFTVFNLAYLFLIFKYFFGDSVKLDSFLADFSTLLYVLRC
jgi:hypothetical protein